MSQANRSPSSSSIELEEIDDEKKEYELTPTKVLETLKSAIYSENVDVVDYLLYHPDEEVRFLAQEVVLQLAIQVRSMDVILHVLRNTDIPITLDDIDLNDAGAHRYPYMKPLVVLLNDAIANIDKPIVIRLMEAGIVPSNLYDLQSGIKLLIIWGETDLAMRCAQQNNLPYDLILDNLINPLPTRPDILRF